MHTNRHSFTPNTRWSSLVLNPILMYIIHKPQHPIHFYHKIVPKVIHKRNNQQSQEPSYMHTNRHSLTLNTYWSTLSLNPTTTTLHHVHHTQIPTPYTFISQGCPWTLNTKENIINLKNPHTCTQTDTHLSEYTLINSITKSNTLYTTPYTLHPCTSYTIPNTLHIFIIRLTLNFTYKRNDQQFQKPRYMYTNKHSLTPNTH